MDCEGKSAALHPVNVTQRITLSRRVNHLLCVKRQALWRRWADQVGCGSGADSLGDGPGEGEEPVVGTGKSAGVGEAVPDAAALSDGEGDGLARRSSHDQSSPV